MESSLENILIGLTDQHITYPFADHIGIHFDAVEDFLKLKLAAEKNGFDLTVASSFRNFENQKNIWDKKARGERPLLDDEVSPLNYNDLSQEQIFYSILRLEILCEIYIN